MPCLGDVPKPGFGLFNVQQVILIFPSFLNQDVAWCQTRHFQSSLPQSYSHHWPNFILSKNASDELKEDSSPQIMSTDMDFSVISHGTAPATLDFARC